MSQIILDISANTTKNDNAYAKRMIDEIKTIDNKKHQIIFKGQLFQKAGDNIVMKWPHFKYIYDYCREVGYKCTASVFDKESLNFLLMFDIPFVKIACNKELYWLIGEVPRKIPIYVSISQLDMTRPSYSYTELECVSKYPARIDEYLGIKHISDHTKDLELFKKYNPKIIEMHYALKDSTGLDVESGVCKFPHQLKEIL